MRAAEWTVAAADARELEDLVTEVAAAPVAAPAQLERLVSDSASQTPVEWQATVVALKSPLKVEVDLKAPNPPVHCWIRNGSSHGTRGVFHLCNGSLSGRAIASWKTRCGWRFGGVPTVVVDGRSPAPRDFELVCKTCAPEIREELGKSVARSVAVAARAA